MADVCDQAADLIQFEGWCQHVGVATDRHTGKVVGRCMIAALNAVTPGDTFDQHEFRWDVRDAVSAFLGLPRDVTIPNWQDGPSRVAGDVIDAYRGTAKALREMQP
jgi:hypothetical protein